MADFNFYLNRQGVKGNKGEKGDTGFAPIVEVAEDTAASYKLRIITDTDTLETPNLRGSAVDDLGGTYMRYDPETQKMYAAAADTATTSSKGEVILASDEAIADLSDVHALTPASLVDNYDALLQSSNGSIVITQDVVNSKIDLSVDLSDIEGDISGLDSRITGCETAIGNIEGDITNLQNNKVDKEAGKGLSTNDFTNADKSKLDSSLQPTSVDGTTIIYNSTTGKISSNIDTSNFVSLNTNQTITGDKLFTTNTLQVTNGNTYGAVAAFDSNLYEMANDSSVSRQAGVLLGGNDTGHTTTLRAGTGMFVGVQTGESGGIPIFTTKMADIYNTYNLTGGTNVSIIKNPSTGLYEIVAHDTTYSQGNGISIDNANQISVKVDGSTVDFNQSGELEVVGGGSITVDQTYDPRSANAQSGAAIAGAGFLTNITSSNVVSALGYTPYDSSNPNGYTSNTGTVTSVNNVSPVSGNVTLTIPTDTSDLTNGAGYITSSALTNYVTTNTAQTITGNKVINGASLTTNDVIVLDGSNSRIVGTVSNNTRGIIRLTSGNEVEIGDTSSTVNIKGSATRPTYNGADLALLSDAGGSAPSNMVTTDTSQTISGHKIFSDYSTEIAGDLHVTKNGTSRIFMGDAYVLIMDDVNDIFTLGDTGKYLKIKAYDTVVISNQRDNEFTVGYDTLTYKKSDDTVVNLLAGGGTVDQTYDGTSTHAQSGVAIEGKLANYQTISNLVTSISSSSTNAQYPSAKCVYDIVGNIESLLHNINSGS